VLGAAGNGDASVVDTSCLTLSDLESLARSTPGLADALALVVDRAEARGGRLPARVTVRATPAVEEALRRCFSARVVRPAAEGYVRIEIGAFLRERGAGAEAALVRALYAATRREPRDPTAEDRAARQALERALAALEPSASTAPSRAFVRAELARLGGDEAPLLDRAREAGLASAERLAADVVRTIDGVVRHRESEAEPIRAQAFAARVLGSSKALRPGGELHRWVAEALFAHDPPTALMMDEAGLALTPAAAREFALGLSGVLHDEAAASVLCFGPVVYTKRGERFDHVARHAALGESSRLVLQQLRGATVERPAARRVTILENLAPYLDYVDACVEAGARDEIVVCSGGQANFAVVALLRRIGAHGVSLRHAGDLDRSGVLILRSLARRAGTPIAPLLMDAATHRRFAEHGRPIAREERARLAAMLAADHAASPCHDLLGSLSETGAWIEQEAFFEDVLAEIRA
jgi:hypothetical protein